MAVSLPSEHSTHKECEALIDFCPAWGQSQQQLHSPGQCWEEMVCLFANGVKNVVVVQTQGHVQLFAAPWTTVSQDSLSITISKSLLKFISIELMMPSRHSILCHPLLLPSIFPGIRVFSNEVSSSHQVAKVLELQHQSFQWIFRVDFL